MEKQLDLLISRVRVRNYRSLADVEVALGPLTALVGLNGTGKSTFVDVLHFLADTMTIGLDSAINNRGGINALRRWSTNPLYDIEISLSISGQVGHGEFAVTLGSDDNGGYRIKREFCAVDFPGQDKTPPNQYEISDGQWVTRPNLDDLQAIMQGLPPEETAKVTTIPKTRLYLPQAFAPGFMLVAIMLRNISIYTISPDKLRPPQNPGNPSPLAGDASNLASVLRFLKEENKPGAAAIVAALPQVMASITDYSVDIVGRYLVINLHHGPDGPAFPLDQESDGTLRALALLAALYQDPPRGPLAIEEPELNIHPGALGVLCDLFREASQRSQIVLTTHSPDLLYHFSAESLRVVDMQNGVTRIGPVAAHQRQAIAQNLFAPGELMRIEGLLREEA